VMLLRKLILIALSILPGGLMLLAAIWLVRELMVRERRSAWEKRFRSWVTPPPTSLLPPSPQP
jgi:hypothetical protein